MVVRVVNCNYPVGKNLSDIQILSVRRISLSYFFQFDDQWEIHSLLIRENFDKPICLDRSDSLNQLNHFPKDIRFQVFLLDKNNKVVVIGNPVHNPNVKELYLEEIGRKQPVAPIQTTVKVEKESLLLETITASYSLPNIIRKEVM